MVGRKARGSKSLVTEGRAGLGGHDRSARPRRRRVGRYRGQVEPAFGAQEPAQRLDRDCGRRAQIDLRPASAASALTTMPRALPRPRRPPTVADLLKRARASSTPRFMKPLAWPGCARRAAAIRPGPSGTTTTGISTRSARSTSVRLDNRIFTAFDEKIAAPIGMQDYQPGDGEYVRGAASDHAAYPIRISARDLARFALLYLHGGRWKDRQLIPGDGFARARSPTPTPMPIVAGSRLWLHVVDRVSDNMGAPAVKWCRRERSRRWGPRAVCLRDPRA